MQFGICHLCKKSKQLSFEHIPPKAAFNKYTKFRSVPFLEYVQNSHRKDYKPNAKLQQGGTGRYCLCRDCNSFLGNNYVPDYFKMAQTGKGVFRDNDFMRAIFTTNGISPLRLLKQIIAMFVCTNDVGFTDANPELLIFLSDPEEKFLPEKFRVFMYLNNAGQIRNLATIYTNHYGLVNEIAFPPLGFVLSMDSNFSFPLTEITHFKDIDEDYRGYVHFDLFNHPTHLPFPIDYRTQEQIDEAIKESEKYDKKEN